MVYIDLLVGGLMIDEFKVSELNRFEYLSRKDERSE